jgi:hypothetical protein
MESATPIMLALWLLAMLVVGGGYLVNLVARRSLLNPWLPGLAALALGGVANGVFLIRAGLLESPEAFHQGELFGKYVAGPVGLPLLFLTWQARRYSRRGQGPDAGKGSIKFALGVTIGFMVLSGFLSAVVGSGVRATVAARADEQQAVAKKSRVEALRRAASEASTFLPKAVDEETVLFKVTAEGETLAHHYRLINLLKAEVEPAAIEPFRAGILESSCSKQVTQERFLRQGYSLQENYYDKNGVLITTVEITAEACLKLEDDTRRRTRG